MIAYDMVGSASQNLVSCTDDSAGSLPPDSQGIIKTGNTEESFGIVDTNNGDTSGRDVIATWVFDISGAPVLGLTIDMGAMGNFEATDDYFERTYSIDGGPDMVAARSRFRCSMSTTAQ